MSDPLVLSAGHQLRDRAHALADATVACEFSRHPELRARYGPAGRLKSRQESVCHLACMGPTPCGTGANRCAISTCRSSSPRCARLRILVGGHSFTVDPALWQKLGVDGTAGDAQAGVALAGRWVAGKRLEG